MIWLFLIVFFYFILYYLIQSTLIVLLLLDNKKELLKEGTKPFVSVLIAARNEEHCIVACLTALDQVNWPPDKIEILIGNDNSEDKTEEKVNAYIADKPKFRLVNIKETIGEARGKANVLAHLAKEAKGDIFCITDADTLVPATWVEGLVNAISEKTGITSGVTAVRGKSWFARYQRMDWLQAFGMIRAMSIIKVPVTAVGNNMAISRKCYQSTGGYENIKFSITEDFELFIAALNRGWDYKNLLEPMVLASTGSQTGIVSFLQQRKRWMHGAIRLPKLLVVVLGIQSLFFPFLLLALLCLPFGILLWLIKFLLQSLFVYLVLKKLDRFNYFKDIWFYELIGPLAGFVQLIFFNLPGKTEWKGRKY